MKEAFARGQCAHLGKQRVRGIDGAAVPIDPAFDEHGDKVARRREQFDQRRPKRVIPELAQFGGACHRPARRKPAQRAPEVEQRMQRRHLLGRLGGECLRALRFGDVYVGEIGHLRQALGRDVEPRQLAHLEQHAELLHAALHGVEPLAMQ